MKINFVKLFALLSAASVFAGCTSSTGQTSLPTTKVQRTASLYDTAFLEGNPNQVWDRLHHTSTAKLAELQSKTSDGIKSAWIQLAVIAKQKNASIHQLASELKNWREKNGSHPANQLFPGNEKLEQIEASTSPKKIAILLPESGAYGASGQVIREGFLNAYYADANKLSQQSVKFYDTNGTKDVASLYQQAVNDGADFVVGPLLKTQVQQMTTISKADVPVLALNYTDGSLPTNVYEFGLLPEDEAMQLADRAFENGKTHAIVIAPKNEWGTRMVSAFTKRWDQVGGNIQDAWYYSAQGRAKFNDDIAALLKINTDTDKLLNQDDDNRTLLSQQRRQDFDVVILFAQPQDARVIVPLLRYYYVTNIPILATSSVYSGKPDPIKDVDLNGIVVCDIPWKLQNSTTPPSHDRLYAVGQDAYKLSQSLQRLAHLTNFPLYGTTGALTIAQDNKIHRRLPCVPVHNGLL